MATSNPTSNKVYAIQHQETKQLFGGFRTGTDGNMEPQWSSSIALISSNREEIQLSFKTLKRKLKLPVEVLRLDKGELDLPELPDTPEE